jgi:hypothetical protein
MLPPRPASQEQSIRHDATRAKALGPDLDRVVGSSLDKGAELDVLAAMLAPGVKFNVAWPF